MKDRLPRLAANALLLIVLGAADAQTFAPRRDRNRIPPQTTQAPDLFAYDPSLPLSATSRVLRDDDAVTQSHVTFLSIRDARVPALWTVPKTGEKPFPSVIVQHGKGGSKESVNRIAERLAREGFATLAIDAPYHGERIQSDADGRRKDIPASGRSAEVRDFITQFVVDLRRAVDFLQSRVEADGERIGYVGISMGANIGGTFCGVESRVKSVVLQVGGTSVRDYAEQAETLARSGRRVLSTDSVFTIAHIAPRPLLMQNGVRDDAVPRWCAETLFGAAREPKKILWYESGHALPSNAQEDMARFLSETL